MSDNEFQNEAITNHKRVERIVQVLVNRARRYCLYWDVDLTDKQLATIIRWVVGEIFYGIKRLKEEDNA